MNLAGLSIKRPSFIAALVVSMLVVGVIMMYRMPQELFPSFNLPYISVTTIYPGGGSREIENLVTKKIEDQVASISGLKNVTSTSQDGFSMVLGEFTLETKSEYAERQVKDKIALIRNQLPKDIQEPLVKRFDPSDRPIITMTVTADMKGIELYDFTDTVIKQKLEQVPNVGSVEILGGTKREIQVEVDNNKLRQYETSLSNVSNKIESNNMNVPVGKVSGKKIETAFRTIGEFLNIEQIKDVIVSFFGSEVPVTVGKLARITDTIQEKKTIGYLNGKSALVINVYSQADSNIVKLADNLNKEVDNFNTKYKNSTGSPSVKIITDSSRAIRMNLSDVRTTIILGIILAVLVVYLFLGNFRSTFITAMALPDSLLGAFIFMALMGFSINMITLMALSLAVGLLIDDSIVVRENIFRHVEEGMLPLKAAKMGTDEVQLAVIATSLTVISVFLPVSFLSGTVGQIFKQFGLTIVFAMVISLFDALTVAPMLSAYLISKRDEKGEEKRNNSILYLPSRWFNVFYKWLEGSYKKLITYTLKHKAGILLIVFAVFAVSIALVLKVPKEFMHPNEFGEFTVDLEANPGTSLSQMETYSKEIEAMLLKEEDIKDRLLTVGNSNGESNVASFYVVMKDEKHRKLSTTQMKDKIREMLKLYNNTVNVSVNNQSMGSTEKTFNLLLKGNDLNYLAKAGREIMEQLKPNKIFTDMDISYKEGKPEFQIEMNPVKMKNFGVQSVLAGLELRNMVEGTVPATFRENGLEYDIRVKLQDDQRNLRKEFNHLYVPNMNFQFVRLSDIAEGRDTTGPSKILRRNRSRYVMISSNLGGKSSIGDATAAADKIIKEMKLPEGIAYEYIGEQEDMAGLFRSMLIAIGLAIVFMYLILFSLYESIITPFTIMMALPFAVTGALIALYVTGQSISLMSMIGFIMLLGLVAKNSILMIDYTQRLIRQGMKRDDAIVKAGTVRLRPILMTTFALIAGMMPMALGLSESGKFRQSMGITVIGGLLSSTFLTLIVIPAIYGFMDSFRRRSRIFFGRPELREIDKAEDGIEA